jgi:diamine N-acetyltransferase
MAAANDVELVDVDAQNWRAVVAVDVTPAQAAFVMPVANYLCLCQYGGVWHPRAVLRDGVVVGHVMWAYDQDEGATWLGGLVVDESHQRRGIGRATVEAFIDEFTADDGSVHVGLSYDPSNVVARSLYRDIGFEETGEIAEGEIVARYIRTAAES